MNNEKKEKLINIAYSTCAVSVIIGAALKIMHQLFGNELILIGLITSVLVNSMHVKLLKQIIRELKDVQK